MIARPVVSVSSAPEARTISTTPPATEDIDSEWPSEPPATGEVDSGWLSEGEPAAEPRAARAAPSFPSDAALPSELWGATGVESRRGSSEPATAVVAVPVAAAAVSPAAPRPKESLKSAEDVARPSAPPARSRGKAVVVAVAAIAAAGLWFARGGSRGPEEPGVQASRPEPTKVEAVPGPAPAPEPALSATSPVGVEASSAGAPIEAGPAPSPSAEAAPAASADPASGKIVVIVNVRPPQARIYYRGKEVGKAPLRVELEPGKRRSFEVGYPGFMTRKIVVDGSKPEVLVGLRPASPYAMGSAPTPPGN